MRTVSPKEKARHAIHRTAQMAGNELFGKMDSVLRNYFAEGRIRKTETKIFEIRRDSGFRPAGWCGRNAGRGFKKIQSASIKKYTLKKSLLFAILVV